MADAVGLDGIHHLENQTCDICAGECDANQELNALTCTFALCNAQVYHQDCLEKFLKSIKCEKNRKTGFQCPRGRGRREGDTCPGRIDKSHPIHPRNDANKKRKQVKVVEPVAVAPRFGPAAKAARQKEKEDKERLKALAAKEEAAQKAIAARAATKARQEPVMDINKQRAAAKALRREIMGVSGPLSPVASTHLDAPEPVRELRTLDEYEAMKGSRDLGATPAPAVPSVNAWAVKGDKGAAEKAIARKQFAQAFPAMPPAAPAQAAAKPRPREVPVPATPVPQPTHRERAPVANQEPDADGTCPTLHAAQSSSFWPQAQTPYQTPYQQALTTAHQTPPSQGSSDIYLSSAFGGLSSQSFHPLSRMSTIQMSPMHMSICASSFSSQHSISSLQSSQQTDGQAAPVGAAYIEAADDSRLTKAQKKNLKRAEKKARQASGQPAEEDERCNGDAAKHLRSAANGSMSGVTQSPMLQPCIAALARFKTLCCLQNLMNMGFAHWLCVAAIQRNGTDLAAACEWVVNHAGLEDPTLLPEYEGPALLVDVSTEMAAIEEALELLPFSASVIHHAVTDHDGNLYESLAYILRNANRLLADPGRADWRVDAAAGERDNIPEAALVAAAAITHDADAGSCHNNFDQLLAVFD